MQHIDQLITLYQQAEQAGLFQLKTRPDLKQAAVLMPMVQRDSEVYLLLTTRAQHLKHHAGQVSFPGGRLDDTDNSLADAAVRETYEEVGVAPELIQVIGHTHQHQTISHYWMTAYLGIVDNSYIANICPNEVEDAFEVPLAPLLNPDTYQKHKVKYQGKLHFYYSAELEGRTIWGATAKILRDFALTLQQIEPSSE